MQPKLATAGPQRLCQRIHALPGGEYELVGPLDIVLEYLDDEVLASIPELGIYGEGLTDTLAIQELKLELLDLADILYEEPEETLGAELKERKKLLDRILQTCT